MMKAASARSRLDDFNSILSDCPQICDAVYGKKDFDLGGIGVYSSFAMNVVLFVALGLLQSFVSYLVPHNASSSYRLAVTRAQLVFDKAYGIGTFLHFGIIAFTTVRLYSQDDPIGTYERSAIQDLLEIVVCLQTVAIISYMVHKVPAVVKTIPLNWGCGSNWLFWIFATVARDWLKSKLGKTPLTVISKLCERSESSAPSEERHYPYVSSIFA